MLTACNGDPEPYILPPSSTDTHVEFCENLSDSDEFTPNEANANRRSLCYSNYGDGLGTWKIPITNVAPDPSSEFTNTAPYADAGMALRVDQPSAELNASGSWDVDGDPLQVRWTQLEGAPVQFLGSLQELKVPVLLPKPGRYRFRLEVHDGTDCTWEQVLIEWPILPTWHASYVVHISIDGLRSDVFETLGPENLPNLWRLLGQGSGTLNARSDDRYTITLPNHTSQLTGRPVLGASGHGWIDNEIWNKNSIHRQANQYVFSVFDVLQHAGRPAALFSSKYKFELFDRTWGRGWVNCFGGPGIQAPITAFVLDVNVPRLIELAGQSLRRAPLPYTFVHIAEPDNTGHRSGWSMDNNSEYMQAVLRVDAYLSTLLYPIENNPILQGRTLLILTSDHGGNGIGHDDSTDWANYRIPFLVWGFGTSPGTDLYQLNVGPRIDPGINQIDSGALSDSLPTATTQPIRNGDAANVALRGLGLSPVPGSVFGHAQPLRLHLP